ncbi:UPF0711 protein C18orf21 homolog [Echinops telfairi]|uniref:UPF0711 protein C18orf21 homolog n=1 Tax=Echinops telfairi TaxID=9371 RepID=A0AC55CXR6_ECHTE|nr:UPF0711 protein C18orf21 homolog [Echinops telfairi]
MRERHDLEAVARELQAGRLLWACSSSHDAENTSEETYPYCFPLLVLHNSQVCLTPKPTLTPQIQTLLNREAKSGTVGFKEGKIVKKYKDAKGVLLVACKTHNRTVKHQGQRRSFLSLLKSRLGTPTANPTLRPLERKAQSSVTHSHETPSSKGTVEPGLDFQNTSIWTVSAHFLFLKGYEQNKDALFSMKNVAQLARIPKDPGDGLQKCLVFSVKDGF